MCSMLDAILARPMEAVLTQLPLPKETQAALRGEDTQARRLLDCAIAYERGEWDRCLELAHRAGFDPTALPAAHRDALRWSARVPQGVVIRAGGFAPAHPPTRSLAPFGGPEEHPPKLAPFARRRFAALASLARFTLAASRTAPRHPTSRR